MAETDAVQAMVGSWESIPFLEEERHLVIIRPA
jgi:hypothetical protein